MRPTGLPRWLAETHWYRPARRCDEPGPGDEKSAVSACGRAGPCDERADLGDEAADSAGGEATFRQQRGSPRREPASSDRKRARPSAKAGSYLREFASFAREGSALLIGIGSLPAGALWVAAWSRLPIDRKNRDCDKARLAIGRSKLALRRVWQPRRQGRRALASA